MTDVVLMDGGHETQLRKYVGSGFEGHPLWISRYLREEPDACRQVFQDFIQSGAELILTNTYQASVANLQQYYEGLTRGEALDLIRLAVKLCQEAVQLEKAKGNTRPVKVAGFIGSYGAYLHDGSEYCGGKYVDKMTIEDLAEWHRPRFEALVEAGCDCLVFGTMPSLKEVKALISLLKPKPGMKACISFSAQNEETISHGEKLSEAAQTCWELATDQILAIGLNCLHPRLVEPLLQSVKKINPNIPLFVKTNTTEIFNTKTNQWEAADSEKSLTEYCRDWLNLGVKYIGGCCRTTVDTVSSFREEINSFKHNTNCKNKCTSNIKT